MKTPRLLAGLLVSVLCFVTGIESASAQLPVITEPPWIGHFSVFVNKRYQFSITSQGKITLMPLNDKSQPVASTLAIPVEITIQEMMPDGKPVWKQIDAKTLTSSQPATDKLEKVVITGKVTGGAAFETTFEQSRGAILIGGRITDPGTLTKNPLRFGVRVKFPNSYPKAKIEDKKDDKKDQTQEDAKQSKEERRAERKAKRDAEKGGAKKDDKNTAADNATLKKIEQDRIDMKWTDGTRKKQTFEETVEAASKDLNGPGIAGAEIENSAYHGRKFLFIASTDSAMTLLNDKPAPLFKGFTIHWVPDATKDKDGKARLSFEVK
jgi:hypothetical protein